MGIHILVFYIPGKLQDAQTFYGVPEHFMEFFLIILQNNRIEYKERSDAKFQNAPKQT